jgi:chromosome segregation ATPase
LKQIKEQINSLEEDLISYEGTILLILQQYRSHRQKLKVLRAWIKELENEPKKTG